MTRPDSLSLNRELETHMTDFVLAPAPRGESARECERLMKVCPSALAVLWEIRAVDARRLEEYRAEAAT